MLKPEIFTFAELTQPEFLKYQTALLPVLVPLEQSPLWGEFNDTVDGRQNLGSFKYEEDGRLIALATAILYRERGRDWIWIKHGPVFAVVPNTEIIKKMCATLKAQFQILENANPIFIRVSMPGKVAPLILPFEHTMYDETVVAELEKTEDELFAGMSQSGRQGVRKAVKCNVEVKEITSDRTDYFAKHCYPILKETGARDGFGIHPLTIYTTMLQQLPEASHLYVSLYEGKVEAWAIITEYNTVAMYYYGGSSAAARETSAAYALHWEVMKIMKERGNKTYDFMGIAGKHFPALKNVTQFKTKFSKNIVSTPLTYDLPIQPLKYRALSLAIKTKRKLKR